MRSWTEKEEENLIFKIFGKDLSGKVQISSMGFNSRTEIVGRRVVS